MKNVFEYGIYRYDYYIEFADRKQLTLIVRPDLRIIVRAPLETTLEQIESFLARKWKWLEKQLNDLRKTKKTHHEREYVSGESYYYLGRQYMLIVEKGDDVVKLGHGKLRIYTSKGLRNSSHNKKLLDGWYARRRDVIFKQEYLQALGQFNYRSFPQLGERVMVRRWGSYTAEGKVLLNPKLIQAPREAIYYVIMHELCHKVSRKHDAVFYQELEKRIPEWRRVKESLEILYG